MPRRLLLLLVLLAPRLAVADPLHIMAAGSLTGAFTEMVAAAPDQPDGIAPPVFGPSGVLRQRIEQGESVDVFASADLQHPRKLAAERGSLPVIAFTRNSLCAVAPARLGLRSDTLLARMLDPALRLATSTPGADPGGDYAWQVFARAEALHPGAQRILEAKALKLVGGPDTPPLVPGHGAVAGVFLADRADVMLGYCSSAQAVMREVPDLASTPLPPELAVGPAYGMVVLHPTAAALRFALFVMSEPGQAILRKFGFMPVGG